MELKAVSVHFLNIFVTRKMRNTPLEIRANFQIFLNTTVQKTNKYDSESHFQDLQADIKITMFSIQEGNFLFLSTNEFLFPKKWPELVIMITFDADRISSPNKYQTDSSNFIFDKLWSAPKHFFNWGTMIPFQLITLYLLNYALLVLARMAKFCKFEQEK